MFAVPGVSWGVSIRSWSLRRTGLWVGSCGVGEELGVQFSNVTLAVFFDGCLTGGDCFYQKKTLQIQTFPTGFDGRSFSSWIDAFNGSQWCDGCRHKKHWRRWFVKESSSLTWYSSHHSWHVEGNRDSIFMMTRSASVVLLVNIIQLFSSRVFRPTNLAQATRWSVLNFEPESALTLVLCWVLWLYAPIMSLETGSALLRSSPMAILILVSDNSMLKNLIYNIRQSNEQIKLHRHTTGYLGWEIDLYLSRPAVLLLRDCSELFYGRAFDLKWLKRVSVLDFVNRKDNWNFIISLKSLENVQ